MKGSVYIQCLGGRRALQLAENMWVGNPVSLLEVFKAVSGTREQKVPTSTCYFIRSFWFWLRLVPPNLLLKKTFSFSLSPLEFCYQHSKMHSVLLLGKTQYAHLLRNRESAHSRDGGGKEISFLLCLPTLPGISVSGTLTPEAVDYVLPSFWLCENCSAHMRIRDHLLLLILGVNIWDAFLHL